jgi:hypothetical protein
MVEQSEKHKCTDICREWHKSHEPRGRKPNSIQAGDPRHMNEAAKQKKTRGK